MGRLFLLLQKGSSAGEGRSSLLAVLVDVGAVVSTGSALVLVDDLLTKIVDRSSILVLGGVDLHSPALLLLGKVVDVVAAVPVIIVGSGDDSVGGLGGLGVAVVDGHCGRVGVVSAKKGVWPSAIKKEEKKCLCVLCDFVLYCL